jgi:hypothetical protein
VVSLLALGTFRQADLTAVDLEVAASLVAHLVQDLERGVFGRRGGAPILYGHARVVQGVRPA